MNIQEAIFESVDIIVDKKLNEVKFDKTIDAIIENDALADKGEYDVRYQDVVFKGFSNNNTVKYKTGDNVYVLIPQGDFSNKKSIIGKKQQTGEEFIDLESIYDKIEKVGGNFVDPEDTVLELIVGKDTYKDIPIRDSDLVSEHPNKLNFLIGATIYSDLINERGDFGLEICFVYADGTEYTFRLSLVDMVGNPYKLNGTSQYKVYNLIISELASIKYARAYVNGFVDSKDSKIIFKNMEIQYVKPREVDNLNQFSAELYAPKGSTFKNGFVNGDSTLELEMRLFKVGQAFNPNPVYKWFYMDPNVNSPNSPGWDSDAGLGWKRIVLENHKDEIEFKDSEKVLVVKPSFVPNFEVIKCIAVFGGEKIEMPEGESMVFGVIKLEALETIVDQTDGVNIAITSSEGDVFKEGVEDEVVASTVLTCTVYVGTEVAESSKFLYTWIKINDDKTQTIIAELQTSEKLTVPVKDDIINTRNYICEVYLREE